EPTLDIDLVLIDLQKNGPLEERDRENQAQGLFDSDNDSDHPRERPFHNSYALADLDKWKRLQRQVGFHCGTQRRDFDFRYWSGSTFVTENLIDARSGQDGQSG